MQMRILVVAILLALASPARSDPGNSERYPVGDQAAGMGGVGVAFGATAWHNLAGLGHADHSVSGSVSAYGLTLIRADRFVDSEVIQGRLESLSVDLFPASLGYVKPLGTALGLDHGLGLSLVVPDYDQFDGVVEVPAERVAFEIRARRVSAAQTFWLVAGWGGCTANQRLCVGLGPALALHKENDLFLLTLALQLVNGDTIDASRSFQFASNTIAAGGQAGVQVRLGDHAWLGATVRSPVRTFYSWGSLLAIAGQVTTVPDAPSYLDRVEVLEPRLDYRRPVRITAGIGYQVPDRFSAGVDVKINAPQAKYLSVGGPSGEVSVQPTLIDGTVVTDPARALDIAQSVQHTWTVDVSAGLEWYPKKSIALQLGGFTDLSSTPKEDVVTEEVDRLFRFGASLGLGLVGKRSTTWLSLIGALGRGDTFGFDENLDSTTTDMESYSILLMLGSRARLGDE